jgi:hypothetical protein
MPFADIIKNVDPKSLEGILKGVGTVGTKLLNNPNRKERIAACGRKPLIGFGKKFRRRKEAYKKCVANLGKSQNAPAPPPPPSNYQPSFRSGEGDGSNKTLLYVGIGVGVLALGVITFLLIRKK